MIVVSDTSPVLNPSAIGKLDLLHQLFGEIVVPRFVEEELRGNGIDMAFYWLRTVSAGNRDEVHKLMEDLDPGESEAIVLAGELGATLLLIDERAGRRAALSKGLQVTGLLGVLAEAKARGIVETCKPLLDGMIREAGFWISKELRGSFLLSVGESVGELSP